MICENDNFSIPASVLEMSREELAAAMEKRLSEIKRVQDPNKEKKVSQSSIKF